MKPKSYKLTILNELKIIASEKNDIKGGRLKFKVFEINHHILNTGEVKIRPLRIKTLREENKLYDNPISKKSKGEINPWATIINKAPHTPIILKESNPSIITLI